MHKSRDKYDSERSKTKSHRDDSYKHNRKSSSNKLLNKSEYSKTKRKHSRSRSLTRDRNRNEDNKYHRHDSNKEDIIHKYKEKNQKHYSRRHKIKDNHRYRRSYSSKSYSSSSSSRSSSSSSSKKSCEQSSYSPQFFNKIKDKKVPESIRKPSAGIKIYGKSLLSNIIQENVSKNQKLDTEEINRATINLKRVAKEEKEAVLMSSYINTLLINEKEENKISKKEQEYQIHNEDSNRAYLCAIDNCGCRFSDPDELKEHLNSHKLL